MRVAAIQFKPTFKDPASNIAKLSTLILEAAENGAELICAPELCTTGYSFMSRAEAEPFAEVISLLKTDDLDYTARDKSLGTFYTLANKLNIVLVWGLVEKDIGTGKLYNSQVYVEPGAELADCYVESYRKVNPFGNDYLWAGRGTKNPPIIRSTRLNKRVGLLICRDVRDRKDDDWKNFYSPGEADIVAFSAAWGDGGFPATSWMDFAEENGVTLVVSNVYGQEANNNFGEGGVCVIKPDGSVACEGLVWSQDCIVYAEV